MKKTLNRFATGMIIAISMLQMEATAQCINAIPYSSSAAPTSGTTTISFCTYQQEYNTITGVAAATTYTSTYSLGGCITVTQGTPGGPVVATGASPLNWTSTVAGNYYVHYTVTCSPTCITAASCGQSDITFVSGGGGGGFDPCTSITPMIGCGASVGATMTGTGAGWSPLMCGWSTPGTESIFSFTATASGVHSIDVTAISGGFIDFAWVNSTAGCGSGVAWNCIADIFSTGNYGAMNWVAGETYYILLDPEGTGTFDVTFNVDCPNPGGPVVAGDCSSAIPVCTNLAFAIDPNGFGLVDELCTYCVSNPGTNPSSSNTGCLNSGELNSTWFELNVANGGVLEFSFGAAGGGNCFDWIMWPLGPTTCADILANTQAPVSCNWNFPCDSYTGIANTLPVGGQAGNFEPGMNVNTGEQYLICFSNYSSALTTVPLDFFGTADISCTPLPVELFGFSGQAGEGYNQLKWSTATEIHSDYFEIERSTNGSDFVKVGHLKAAGTSFEELAYRFNDYSFESQTNYYRIKQVDFNGDYRFSDVIAIDNMITDGFKIVSAFPNPAKETFNIQLYVIDTDLFEISIREASGKMIDAFTDQKIAEGTNMLKLPVDHLAQGIYYVTISDSKTEQLETVKLVVQ